MPPNRKMIRYRARRPDTELRARFARAYQSSYRNRPSRCCAKPGFEPEWRRLLQRFFAGEELSNNDTARFQQISIPGFQRIDAPRVGFDSAADAWIIEKRKAETPAERAAVLRDFHGYYVLRLVQCDGVPRYSNGGLYEGADETSFRGDFLKDCADVLGQDLLNDAWNSKMPEAAVSYGETLLATADAAEAADSATRPRTGFLSRIGLAPSPREPIPIAEQLAIVRAAGRWFIFWGERGHPIHASF